jgi:glycosyltransferase involved in cell wall biosynthesis
VVTIFLPLEKEGFYLPALEGMAMGTLVVCPDCLGNRGFCLDGINGLRPNLDKESILAAALRAVRFPSSSQEVLKKAAQTTVNEHHLASEKERFLEILDQLEDSI